MEQQWNFVGEQSPALLRVPYDSNWTEALRAMIRLCLLSSVDPQKSEERGKPLKEPTEQCEDLHDDAQLLKDAETANGFLQDVELLLAVELFQ